MRNLLLLLRRLLQRLRWRGHGASGPGTTVAAVCATAVVLMLIGWLLLQECYFLAAAATAGRSIVTSDRKHQVS